MTRTVLIPVRDRTDTVSLEIGILDTRARDDAERGPVASNCGGVRNREEREKKRFVYVEDNTESMP